MNELETAQKTIDTLKIRLFDISESVNDQNRMMSAISARVGFKGGSFEELLALLPEVSDVEVEVEVEPKPKPKPKAAMKNTRSA